MGENGWRDDLTPYYSAFTDNNSSFEGTIVLPTKSTTVYLSSAAMGIPSNIPVQVMGNKITYAYTPPQNVMSRVAPSDNSIDIGSRTKTINSGNKLFALYDYYQNYYNSNFWVPRNGNVSGLYKTLPASTQLTANSSLGALLNRINQNFVKTDNTNLIVPSENINIKVKHQTADGNPVEGAHLDLIFLRASGAYHNAMGYYYYPTGANLTGAQIRALPKFMVFPRTTRYYPSQVIKARLQFYGANYNTTVGTDDFPPGYTIGFVLVSNMADWSVTGRSLSWYSNTGEVNTNINAAIQKNPTHAIYSNSIANRNQLAGCIALLDEPSERIILGFEDQTYRGGLGDKSMEDILFYVKADPFEAVMDIADPDIPDLEEDAGNNANPLPETLVTDSIKGTLAFEDIWPNGGDYDMNDVVVEYKTEYQFNSENVIKKIVDSFTLVHSGAEFTDAFGYIITGTVGTIDEQNSNYAVKEEANQFIFCENCKVSVGNTYKITRTFNSNNGPSVNDFTKGYNPFIVPNYVRGEKNRKEVHLPKTTASSWANMSLNNTQDDAFFINKSGKYPFAIDLVNVRNFKVVTESVSIGSTREYPDFNKWADKDGKEFTDWYTRKEE
jgi:hypothetical protein